MKKGEKDFIELLIKSIDNKLDKYEKNPNSFEIFQESFNKLYMAFSQTPQVNYEVTRKYDKLLLNSLDKILNDDIETLYKSLTKLGYSNNQEVFKVVSKMLLNNKNRTTSNEDEMSNSKIKSIKDLSSSKL